MSRFDVNELSEDLKQKLLDSYFNGWVENAEQIFVDWKLGHQDFARWAKRFSQEDIAKLIEALANEQEAQEIHLNSQMILDGMASVDVQEAKQCPQPAVLELAEDIAKAESVGSDA